jgi:hypothetical protein
MQDPLDNLNLNMDEESVEEVVDSDMSSTYQT